MIYIECYSDKALMKAIGVRREEIRHAGDKGKVCNFLKKNTNSKGVVDQDPLSEQPIYIETLKLVSDQQNIRYFYDKNLNNHLIMLCPKLEDWILRAAEESKVNLQDYNLPSNADELHKVSNRIIERFDNFIKLIEDIKRRSKMLKDLDELLKKK